MGFARHRLLPALASPATPLSRSHRRPRRHRPLSLSSLRKRQRMEGFASVAHAPPLLQTDRREPPFMASPVTTRATGAIVMGYSKAMFMVLELGMIECFSLLRKCPRATTMIVLTRVDSG
ncbi:hypothetical protein LR48_Vigan843s000500 [Vigna angularis]|uniref:Uncharacterized protein n=1 Tax=Phaseolus angularis TaxID=3914 RepID=A0A0L9TH77_PHAAN|nr:hypothetical protein LR48_Vigan843s000500 [Vigna angularis]